MPDDPTKARPYDLTDAAERHRLLRETVGYARVSLVRGDGTDAPGREFAYAALRKALDAGYELVLRGKGDA